MVTDVPTDPEVGFRLVIVGDWPPPPPPPPLPEPYPPLQPVAARTRAGARIRSSRSLTVPAMCSVLIVDTLTPELRSRSWGTVGRSVEPRSPQDPAEA